ncbi:hypothetical protein KKF59_00485 [Patescibacteria group bacterium]|nr:hypothetical protein [Patescibacteria group bacterium]
MERKNIIYGIILGALVAAILVVAVLILRKRAEVSLPFRAKSAMESKTQLPEGTRPIESYTPERPWQEGDAPIPMEELPLIEPQTEI